MILEWTFEQAAWAEGYQRVAGVDEVGRGPLAGPVLAAAVILPPDISHPWLRDSKQVPAVRRAEVAAWLRSTPGVAWAIAEASVEEIDRLNIRQAAFLAMQRAVESLSIAADFLLIDGNATINLPTPQRAIVKGDSLSPSIAAASILAKEARDALMCQVCEQFPQYGFSRHKGYGTAEHTQALQHYGPCPLHRKSFAPIRSAAGARAL